MARVRCITLPSNFPRQYRSHPVKGADGLMVKSRGRRIGRSDVSHMGMCSSDKYFKPKKGWCVMRLLVLESMILAVFMTGNILADELKSSYQDVVSQKEPQGAVEKLGYGTQQVKEKFVDVIKEGTDRVSGAVNSFDTGMVKAMGLVDKVARLREEEEEIKKMIAEGTIRMEVGLDLLDHSGLRHARGCR